MRRLGRYIESLTRADDVLRERLVGHKLRVSRLTSDRLQISWQQVQGGVVVPRRGLGQAVDSCCDRGSIVSYIVKCLIACLWHCVWLNLRDSVLVVLHIYKIYLPSIGNIYIYIYKTVQNELSKYCIIYIYPNMYKICFQVFTKECLSIYQICSKYVPDVFQVFTKHLLNIFCWYVLK